MQRADRLPPAADAHAPAGLVTPKVLHVAQPTTAGVARGVAALAEDQQRRGWAVTVACPDDGDLPSWLPALGVRHEPWHATRAPGPQLASEVLGLRRVLARVRPDIVHLHSSKAGAVGRLCLRGRLPVLFQPHAWSFAALEGRTAAVALRWERFATRWTDVIVCVSDGERREGEAAGIRGAFLTAPNGVDLSRYAVADAGDVARARTSLGIGPSPLAVCVGRVCRQKGQDLLLTAWPEVRRQVPGARLALVGDGPDRPRLEALAGEGVDWVGDVADVRPWLTASDVVALPSRWEGLAFTMLEAMATGRSVVTASVSGSEVLADGTAGAVVPVESPRALADALTTRLANPSVSAAEGRAARALAVQHYDRRRQQELVADRTLALVERRGPRRRRS